LVAGSTGFCGYALAKRLPALADIDGLLGRKLGAVYDYL
jgi:nucleoside-diphosphate-sugar epimerase